MQNTENIKIQTKKTLYQLFWCDSAQFGTQTITIYTQNTGNYNNSKKLTASFFSPIFAQNKQLFFSLSFFWYSEPKFTLPLFK